MSLKNSQGSLSFSLDESLGFVDESSGSAVGSNLCSLESLIHRLRWQS